MNPYLQEALDPTLKELRRQSDISRLTDAGRLTQAGAYGGSRQAIMESESRRNLLDQISRTTGEGYSRAYDSAAGQFNTEQAKRIQEAQFGAGQNLQSAQLAAQFGQSAQQMGEQSRQFGAQQALQNAQNRAQYGLAGLQIGEQSRQFGAQQAANAASEAAKFGQSAQQMGEQSRQFGAQQGLTAADMAARYGLAGLQLGEQSRQFGAQQGLTAADMAARYGLASQQAAEQSKQYGAGFGLDALTKGLSAAQLQGSLGMNMADVQRQNVLSQLYGGAQQREVDQAGVAADLAEFEKQRAYPMEMLKFQQAMLQNMPISAENRTYNEPSELSQVLTGAGGLAQLYDILYPKTTPTTTTP
jgi:bisphosphoglycerate-dependent phosphoglycerate mutase